MASGVILALSMVLTGLSPNVIYVFLSFGICGGLLSLLSMVLTGLPLNIFYIFLSFGTFGVNKKD